MLLRSDDEEGHQADHADYEEDDHPPCPVAVCLAAHYGERLMRAIAPAPKTSPPKSKRLRTDSMLSGRTRAPATKATSPKNRLNQKTARQDQSPTRVPADERTRRESQPGQRLPRSPSAFALSLGLAVDLTDHRQRPRLGRSRPQAHDRPGGDQHVDVRGEGGEDRAGAEDGHSAEHDPLPAEEVAKGAGGQHEAGEDEARRRSRPIASPATPACRLDWMLASVVLTTVLSRNVRNRTSDRVASPRWAYE